MPRSGPPEGYIEVKDRLVTLYEKHPDARLQTTYRVEQVGPLWFVVAIATVWKSPEDPLPSTGMAWEPVPGKTPYTRDSELMNAETSAWGRALVAAGIADAKQGIASANEVRNRNVGEGGQRDNGRPAGDGGRAAPAPSPAAINDLHRRVRRLVAEGIFVDGVALTEDELRHRVLAVVGRASTKDLTAADMPAVFEELAAAEAAVGITA